MAAVSWVFGLFDEHHKYRAYLPAVVFAYLYYLSNESAFILTAVFFAAIATGLVEAWEVKVRTMESAKGHDMLTSEQKRDIFHSHWLEAFRGILGLINAIGYLVAAAASWNNVVEQGLMIPSLPERSGTGFINVLLSDYVSTSDILLNALLFLVLVIIMRTLLSVLVETLYRRG